MSISTTTDIVLDVARAADPKRLQAATRKLANQALDAGASDFATLIDKPAAQASLARPAEKFVATAFAAHASAKQARTTAADRPTETAYQALGGILLQKAFESAMPDGASSLFGKGTAGAVWKSMLAQQMASGVSPSIFKLPRSAAVAGDEALAARPVSATTASLT